MSMLSKVVRFVKINRRKFVNAVIPYRQRPAPRHTFKISAYLCIFNDGDFLESVLACLKPYIDELIVVDGAYGWMVPYLEHIGIDPLRSDDRIYEAIARSGIPYRVINQIWENELEKRGAGYGGCTHRYVMRIDADELVFFNPGRLEEFVGSGCAVAEMRIPLYLAPGFVVGSRFPFKYPNLCLIFDSHQISPSRHLEYLWLVLPADHLLRGLSHIAPVFEKSLAFCAHLPHWRRKDYATQRAVFYIFNWMRKNGIPWLRQAGETKPFDGSPSNLSQLLDHVPVAVLQNALGRSHVAFGFTCLDPRGVVVPTPLNGEQEALLVPYYAAYLESLAEANRAACQMPQSFIHGEPIYLDFTTDGARSALVGKQNDRRICLEISPDVERASVCLISLDSTPGGDSFQCNRNSLPIHRRGGLLQADLTTLAPSRTVLRQFLEIRFELAAPDAHGWFQVVDGDAAMAEGAVSAGSPAQNLD